MRGWQGERMPDGPVEGKGTSGRGAHTAGRCRGTVNGGGREEVLQERVREVAGGAIGVGAITLVIHCQER
jgi:hypothetical protein